MRFYPENLYHIYNRGNNKQVVFIERKNYLFFLRKVRKELLGFCEILAYCLMPTHFHFLVYTKRNESSDDFESSDEYALNNGIAVLLRSYTRAINKQENRSGSLFQQKTKAKCLTNYEKNSVEFYPFICFHYIHQNPYAAKLVKKLEDWESSSFKDYIGLRNGTLCNQYLARELLNLPTDKNEFYEMSYDIITRDKLDNIF